MTFWTDIYFVLKRKRFGFQIPGGGTIHLPGMAYSQYITLAREKSILLIDSEIQLVVPHRKGEIRRVWLPLSIRPGVTLQGGYWR